MADLSTHYKEITPEQTVQNIIDFFKEKKYETRLIDVAQTEAGTWYSRINLYKDGIYINGTNGKGVTKEYCLASGYAELYERFCNKIFFLSSPWWIHDYMKENYNTNSYYFSPLEKPLTFEEELNNSVRIRQYVNKTTGSIPALQHAMIDFITEKNYIGVPMYNLKGEPELYVDPRLLMRVTRSNGMAAGNTLEEALVQGLSEIVEREATDATFKDMGLTHYAIKLDKIENPVLQDLIHNIQMAGFNLYLFDLSYNFQLPVIMSLLIDRDNGVININFGSFPVFEIAAERVITELYQGIQSYKEEQFRNRLQIPSRIFGYQETLQTYANAISGEIFSLDFFQHITYVDTYNHEVFTEKNSTNKELLQYYINLEEKLGLRFYYLNNSLSNKMYAVHIILESEHPTCSVSNTINIVWNDVLVQKALNYINNLNRFYTEMLYEKTVDIPNFIQLTQIYDDSLFMFIDCIMLWHRISILPRGDFHLLGLLMWPMEYDEGYVSPDLSNTECFKNIKKYLQLLKYRKTGMYSDEELEYIFNEVFNYNITKQDLDSCFSAKYLLNKAYIEPMKLFLNSKSYKEIIQSFTSNHTSG